MIIKAFSGAAKKEIYQVIAPMNDAYYYPINLKRANYIFVGYVSGQAVSFLGMNQRNGWWYFRGCFVEPDHRGKGYQVQLMEAGFEKLKELNVGRVSSLVHIENKYSLANALKVGFKVTGRRKENYHIVAKWKH